MTPFTALKKWCDTTSQLLYLDQQCQVFLRMPLSKGTAYIVGYPCRVTNHQLISTEMMLVIALLTNVFVQEMSMAVQSSLVQGQNASLEYSGTKKK